MDERTDRILTVAMELAERDGYDAVRLRDLAAQADVALGTVYRRFSCKEDILAAVLEQQVTRLHETIFENPIQGDTAMIRLNTFFEIATQMLVSRPKLAAALLRTVASGVPELCEKVTQFHGRMKEIIVVVHRGEVNDDFPTVQEETLSQLLLDVWFATMVGWTGGVHTPASAQEHVRTALGVVMRGLERTS